MIENTIEVRYQDSAAVIETYPPEWAEGVPSAASCIVYRGDVSLDDTSEFTPSVTVDGVSATVNTASGYSQSNRRRLYLTSTSGVDVSRYYLLSNEYGQRELVRPTKISTDTYVDLKDDLAYDYSSSTSCTFKGLRLYFTVDSTWVATESKINAGPLPGDAADLAWGDATVGWRRPSYKAVWAYTVNSIARRHYSYIRLVRQKSQHNVTAYDLERFLPEILLSEYKDSRGNQARDLIDAAWDAVRADLITEGTRPDQFRDTELIDQLVLRKALYFAAWRGQAPAGWDPVPYAEQRRADYEKFFGRVIGGMKIDIDQGAEGAATASPYRPMFFK